MVLRDIEEFNMPVIVISAKVRNPKIPHLAQSSICNLPTVDCRLRGDSFMAETGIIPTLNETLLLLVPVFP
ncbi:hypothetical protein KsCSTR_10890 [Candidatus Kuenenia stuttgartiensis]|uniref:Uncharacterized protein n=1 Tax=Kuenenia stuttgartiensis TaxID=174633 RepID=A0A2C9CFX0_KUEST|nr:hypothetical protein KsCSTR_10890 [Candidatus Kuenenia stuttgartiensis]SOH03647.1 hypothetical protein KSMBR1_1144 [Candidatus Kuenenia stuttgartiensis]